MATIRVVLTSLYTYADILPKGKGVGLSGIPDTMPPLSEGVVGNLRARPGSASTSHNLTLPRRPRMKAQIPGARGSSHELRGHHACRFKTESTDCLISVDCELATHYPYHTVVLSPPPSKITKPERYPRRTSSFLQTSRAIRS